MLGVPGGGAKFFALNPRTTAWAEVEKITANYAAMATKLAAEWETCAAISRRTQKRLQVDGGLCYPLPPAAGCPPVGSQIFFLCLLDEFRLQ